MAEFDSKVNFSSRVQNDINRSEKKGEKRATVIGKDDRATTEQVLDPRTRLMLFKLLSSGFLQEIDGCLSTGKEANVYYARGQDDREYAVKIFKTSILVFKDRDKYVSGEYRFANGYCKSNPRKMVKIWAEKEMRNLKRMHSVGIPCPEPFLLKSHILIMQFLGNNAWCAPRIRDVELTMEELISCYTTIVIDMRRMYHECNLVHGDLSEYNLLWHEGRAVIIDVSQSVEQHHPLASEFLRKDCQNVTDFFRKKCFNVLSTYRLYQFITQPSKCMLTYTAEKAAELAAAAVAAQEMAAAKTAAQTAASAAAAGDDSTEPQLVPVPDDTTTAKASCTSSAATAAPKTPNFTWTPTVEELKDELILTLQTYSEVDEEDDEDGPEGGGSAAGRAEDPMEQHSGLSNAAAKSRQKATGDMEDSIFLQTFIPTHLGEIVNMPHVEQSKLAKGERGSLYADAISNMVVSAAAEIEERRKDRAGGDGSDSEDSDEEGSEEEGSDDDEDDDDDSQYSDYSDADGTYRRVLPSHDKPEQREQAKQDRKEAKKLAKLQAAEKRKTKLPKHLKKRAMKVGKKK